MMRWIARQKFRFDLGQGFMGIATFTVALIGASDKLATLIHVPAKVMLVVLVPTAILSVWLFGYILDKKKFYHAYQAELNRRNEMLSKVCEEAQKRS